MRARRNIIRGTLIAKCAIATDDIEMQGHMTALDVIHPSYYNYRAYSRAVERGKIKCKIMCLEVGGMNSLKLKTLETKKNNLQDNMRRSRDTPDDDFGHEFDVMTDVITPEINVIV